MSLKTDIHKLKQLLKPKKTIRFILNIDEIDESEGVVWVLFEL